MALGSKTVPHPWQRARWLTSFFLTKPMSMWWEGAVDGEQRWKRMSLYSGCLVSAVCAPAEGMTLARLNKETQCRLILSLIRLCFSALKLGFCFWDSVGQSFLHCVTYKMSRLSQRNKAAMNYFISGLWTLKCKEVVFQGGEFVISVFWENLFNTVTGTVREFACVKILLELELSVNSLKALHARESNIFPFSI